MPLSLRVMPPLVCDCFSALLFSVTLTVLRSTGRRFVECSSVWVGLICMDETGVKGVL